MARPVEKNIKKVYHINNKANVRFDELAKQESNHIFLTSVFTSWITPCTVWYNNFEMKSYYLLFLSGLTLAFHGVSIAFHYVVINKFPQMFPNNLSLFHCFGNETIFGNTTHKPVIQGNLSRIEICFDCLPPLTFCSPTAGPSQLFNSYIGPLALALLILSALSAVALQLLGHYHVMYKWTNIFFCKSPIVHLSLLTDFMENAESLPTKVTEKMTYILNRTIENNGRDYLIVDDGDSLTDNRNLMFFALEFKFTGVVCRLIKILKDVNFEGRSKKYLEKIANSINDKESIWEVDEAIKMVLINALEREWPVKKMAKVWHKQPMMKLIKKGDLVKVCFLHMLGADLDISNEKGEVATKVLLKMIQRAQIKFDNIGKFTKYYINSFLHSPNRHSLLQTAVLNGYDKCFGILLENGADVNYTESLNGKTCLHLAASNKRKNILEILLEKNKKLDLNRKDISWRTPLHYAAEMGHLEVAKFLLEKDSKAVDPKDKCKTTPLHLPASEGHEEVVEKDEKVVDPKDKGKITPLYLAASEGHYPVVEFLVDRGASVNAKAIDGSTPLHQAVRFNHTNVAKFIFHINLKGPSINAEGNLN